MNVKKNLCCAIGSGSTNPEQNKCSNKDAYNKQILQLNYIGKRSRFYLVGRDMANQLLACILSKESMKK